MTDMFQKPTHRKRNIVLLVVIPVTAFVITAVLVYVFVIVPRQSSSNGNGGSALVDQDPATPQEVIERNERRAEINKVAVEQGYAAGQDVVKQQLSTAKTDEEKGTAYIDLANLAVSSAATKPNYTEALDYAYKAEELHPTYETAVFIAQIEDYFTNNPTAAAKYYRLAASRATDQTETLNPGDKDAFLQRAAELEK